MGNWNVYRTSLCFLVAGGHLLSLAACTEGGQDEPGAGQTGSPVVPPDYESPVPFRPPSNGGNPDVGPSLPIPRRVLRSPTRLASVAEGSLRFVAAPGGLAVIETPIGESVRVVGARLQDTVPLWVGAEGSNALSIVNQKRSDSAREERLQTAFYSFPIAGAEQEGRLAQPQQLLLPGHFVQAKRLPGRVVVLTEGAADGSCSPESGPRRSYRTETMIVSDLRLEQGEWSVAETLRVAARGYVETDSAYVLTTLTASSEVGELVVVEVLEDALKAWPAVDLSAETAQTKETLSEAPMGVSEGKLAILLANGAGIELRVIELDAEAAAGPVSMSFQVSESVSDRLRFVQRSFFRGEFAVLPGSAVTEQSPLRGFEPGGAPNSEVAHALVRWSAEGGVQLVEQLPEDLQSVLPMGERFLGLGEQRSVVLALNAEGQLEQQYELPASPAAGRHNWKLHFDAARQQAVLPYRLPGQGSAFAEYAVAVLSGLDGPNGQAAWSEGTRVGLEPSGRGGVTELTNVAAVGTEDWWILGLAGNDSPSQHVEVQAFSPGDERAEALVFAQMPADTRLIESEPVTLSQNASAQASVSGLGGEVVELQYAAKQLAVQADTVFAYDLGYSNACYPDGVFEADELRSSCVDSGRAGLATLSVEASSPLIGQIALPLPLLPSNPQADVRTTYEWKELVAQDALVALLQRRAVQCQSEASCDALGIEYEITRLGGGTPMCADGDNECVAQMTEPTRRISGDRNEIWMYPFDVEGGEFAEPVLIGSYEPYGWISAEGLVVQGSGAALLRRTPLGELSAGIGVATARYELLQWPDAALKGPGAEAPKVSTLPGVAVWVNGLQAISIEPTGTVEEGGTSVGTLLHRLSLQADGAHMEQTLELPGGHSGHRWAQSNGYVLLTPDDQCANREVELLAVGLREGQLQRLGSLTLEGTRWRLAEATDELVRLTRTVDGLDEHALIEVSDAGLSLKSRLSARAGTPIALRAGEAHLALQQP